MKPNNRSLGGDSLGASGSRVRANTKHVHNSHSSPDGTDFISHIARMDQTLRAHTESARLQLFKQQAAWWKSQFVAAQYENRMLKQLLDQVYQVQPGSNNPHHFSSPVYGRAKKQRKRNKKKKKKRSSQCADEDSDVSTEFELSDEFKRFLDVNRLHREEREREKTRLRRERGSESEKEIVERMEQEPTDCSDRARQEELRELYGDEWKHIEGLETYVQMKYDQFCDRNKPAYWPNIPLNL